MRRAILACGMLALAMVSLCGCSREFFRLHADKEVKYLVTQKSNDPRWQNLNYTIGMDPRARYFDPTNPDCPPMPYDDPASNRYMKCVAGRKQWPCWQMNGEWYYLENPRWKDLLAQYNEVTEDGAIKLSMNGAVCLAQVHSSNYRQQIETIYLSALDVSSERFAFDVQFFGDSETVFDHQGALRSPLGEQNSLTQRTGTGFRRGLSAGGQLLVGFANTVVWQFAGPDSNFTTSLLNFSLIQPLLRNGGRAFVMERLTITERALLANLRAFQYYRQGFYANVTVGANNVAGPRREGGFFGGTGLTGFSGQGAGGFGGVGGGNFGIGGGGGGAGGAGGAAAGFVGGGAGQVGGFIGLLQTKQQVANLQGKLNALLGTLALLEANLDAGLIDIVQVDEFRQNIETTRATLLGAEIGYQDSLDGFKVGTLGLPPDTDVAVDDAMLEQFQFLDPDTVAVRNMIDDFVRVVGDLPEDPMREDLAKALATLTVLRDRLGEQFTSAHADMEKLDTAAPARTERMSQSEKQTFATEREKLQDSLNDVETRFTGTESVLQNLHDTIEGGAAGERALGDIVSLGVGLSGLTQELALVKARARLETVTIPHIELNGERALNIARANRLDWMNNRASLVDQWRLITFNANLLKAGLDLTFEGDVRTVGNNPLDFNGRDGALRVGVAFDAPLARRLERNDYRSALIFYQQQRRLLYGFQDGVNLSLRARLRQLAQLDANMEIQRRAVVIAVRRVDKTREDLNRPPAPVEPGMPVEALGPTVAQNLIFALNDLTDAQNNLMSVVLRYYESRMLLYRDLGILELDDCGMWIDRPLEEAVRMTEEQCEIPPNVPVDWLEEAGVDPSELHGGAGGQPEEVAPVGEMPDAEPIKPIEMPGVRGAGRGALPTIPVRRTTGKQRNSRYETGDYGLEELPPVAPAQQRGLDRLNGEASQTARSSQTVEVEGERTSAREIKLMPTSNRPSAEDSPAILRR